jgi:hypothetical protein
MKMKFLCGTQINHALAYVHGQSRSREFVYKIRIQVVALYVKVIMSHVFIHGRPRLGEANQMEN